MVVVAIQDVVVVAISVAALFLARRNVFGAALCVVVVAEIEIKVMTIKSVSRSSVL